MQSEPIAVGALAYLLTKIQVEATLYAEENMDRSKCQTRLRGVSNSSCKTKNEMVPQDSKPSNDSSIPSCGLVVNLIDKSWVYIMYSDLCICLRLCGGGTYLFWFEAFVMRDPLA